MDGVLTLQDHSTVSVVRGLQVNAVTKISMNAPIQACAMEEFVKIMILPPKTAKNQDLRVSVPMDSRVCQVKDIVGIDSF